MVHSVNRPLIPFVICYTPITDVVHLTLTRHWKEPLGPIDLWLVALVAPCHSRHVPFQPIAPMDVDQYLGNPIHVQHAHYTCARDLYPRWTHAHMSMQPYASYAHVYPSYVCMLKILHDLLSYPCPCHTTPFCTWSPRPFSYLFRVCVCVRRGGGGVGKLPFFFENVFCFKDKINGEWWGDGHHQHYVFQCIWILHLIFLIALESVSIWRSTGNVVMLLI
jgi:hypothetical protein